MDDLEMVLDIVDEGKTMITKSMKLSVLSATYQFDTKAIAITAVSKGQENRRPKSDESDQDPDAIDQPDESSDTEETRPRIKKEKGASKTQVDVEEGDAPKKKRKKHSDAKRSGELKEKKIKS